MCQLFIRKYKQSLACWDGLALLVCALFGYFVRCHFKKKKTQKAHPHSNLSVLLGFVVYVNSFYCFLLLRINKQCLVLGIKAKVIIQTFFVYVTGCACCPWTERCTNLYFILLIPKNCKLGENTHWLLTDTKQLMTLLTLHLILGTRWASCWQQKI